MEFVIGAALREKESLRESFMDLAIRTFDLDFHSWYQNGYWGDTYIPYALVENETVIANASVNLIDTIWQGAPRRYIQIGTVMTDAAYRNQGLARRVLQRILQDWEPRCDGIYLYANDSVLDFYPKFGFQRAIEYQASTPLVPISSPIRKLDLRCPADMALLRQRYMLSNPFSALPMVDNWGLLMFYCGSFMANCVYELPEQNLLLIAEFEGDTMICHDIYGETDLSLLDVLNAAAGPSICQAVLGFTPKDSNSFILSPVREEDTIFFVLQGKENLFLRDRLMFPALSHA